MKKYSIKCDTCGRFIKIADICENKVSYLFIPDSDVSYEEEKYRCESCTKKYGKPISMQPFVSQL